MISQTRKRRSDRRSLHPHPVSWHQLQRSAAGPQSADIPRERPPAAPFCSQSLYLPVNQIQCSTANAMEARPTLKE